MLSLLNWMIVRFHSKNFPGIYYISVRYFTPCFPINSQRNPVNSSSNTWLTESIAPYLWKFQRSLQSNVTWWSLHVEIYKQIISNHIIYDIVSPMIYLHLHLYIYIFYILYILYTNCMSAWFWFYRSLSLSPSLYVNIHIKYDQVQPIWRIGLAI